MKKTTLFLFPLLLLLIGCQSKEQLDIQLMMKGENNDPTFRLLSPAFKNSLKITNSPANELGSIYFKTSEGKHWVRGNPVDSRMDTSGYQAKWEIDKREVSISIIRDNKDFVISFEAQPDDGILGWGLNLDAQPDEYFTGLFERTVDGNQSNSWKEGITEAMNLRGQQVDMLIKPTLSLYAPFYVSSRGYGMKVYGTWPGKYDIAKEIDNRVQIYFEGDKFKARIYTRKKPADIVKAHTLDAGPPLVPPKWVFSHWRWRDNHTNKNTYYDGTPAKAPYNSMVVEDILMMEALDIPCGVYWIDRPWDDGSYGYNGNFEWDKNRIPNPEKMITWLKNKDIRFLLWIAPWVADDVAREAIDKEYFLPGKGMNKLGIHSTADIHDEQILKKAQNKFSEVLKNSHSYGLKMAYSYLFGSDGNGVDEEEMYKQIVDHIENLSLEEFKYNVQAIDRGVLLVDFTNPQAVEWWQNKGPAKVLKQGVKGFKLDRSEEIVPETRACKAYDGRTTREIRNEYPVQYVKATYDIARKVHDDDFVLIPRAGYTGSSQYGVFWGGDIASPAEGLRAAIIALQRSSVMGYPLWGSDIGGYWGTDLDREVTARWLAFGCFNPIMEVGPTEDKGLWDMDDKPQYDPKLIAVWRTYATLHTQLMDYTYQQAQVANKTGMPVARPLFMAYPEQAQAKKDWQTYLYGPDILVSAIWQKGKEKHEVYLPKGETWVDAWDGKEYQGGQQIAVDVPLYKIPVFVRKGADVDLGDLQSLYDESLEIAKKQPDMRKLQNEADFEIE